MGLGAGLKTAPELGWAAGGAGWGWAVGGWVGLAGAGAAWWWVGLGWAGLGLAVDLFENGKVCLHRTNELPDCQQQQAISIYFFLEGLGFVVLGFRVYPPSKPSTPYISSIAFCPDPLKDSPKPSHNGTLKQRPILSHIMVGHLLGVLGFSMASDRPCSVALVV